MCNKSCSIQSVKGEKSVVPLSSRSANLTDHQSSKNKNFYIFQ